MWRVLLLGSLLSACTQFPELDATLSEEAQNADYPALIQLDSILAEADAALVTQINVTGGINARVARLQSRARQLRGAVIDRRTRIRMKRGVRTAGL